MPGGVMSNNNTKEILLKVTNLQTHLSRYGKRIYAVDGVDFELAYGETLGLVGESGCGKSMTALSIMGLVPGYPGIVEGEIYFSGLRLTAGSEIHKGLKGLKTRLSARRSRTQNLKEVRGKKIGMVFQEPELSLDTLFPIGMQIAEVIMAHSDGFSNTHWWQPKKRAQQKKEALSLAGEWLNKLHIDAKITDYPYELSGGMQQRVSIAAALVCKPLLLIADEPTTALDATIQVKVLNLLQEIKEKANLSILLIGHDISVISALSDRVLVMYNGRIMERGNSKIVLNECFPDKHPYTLALLRAVPRIFGRRRLLVLSGDMPDASVRPSGCRFATRCELKKTLSAEIQKKCHTEEPQEFQIELGHTIRCWNWNEFNIS